ncbi:hypothetical protein D9M71_479320 [compost metagenome]
MFDHIDVEAPLQIVEKQFRRAILPGPPGLSGRQVVAVGEGPGLIHVEFAVLGYILVRQQNIAIVLGDVVFVGDQYRRYRRVVFIGKAGESVYMGQVILGKAFHGLLERDVHIGIAFEAGSALVLWQLLEGIDVVVGSEGALHVHVEPDINAFVFEALDPPVDFLQRCSAQLLGILDGVSLAKHVRADPWRVMVVQAHEIEAQCRQAFGLLFDLFVGCIEDRIRRHVGAPEARRGVIGKQQLFAGGFDEAALAGRFFWRIEK